ncbi:MAG: hypothetical protein KME64_27915 [Scytonematopsis contorta HA4267-MV1]|jgi:hypothetical protein|nr:hypothetical protein [Scytonematopsis contorta HA4267-MV1]
MTKDNPESQRPRKNKRRTQRSTPPPPPPTPPAWWKRSIATVLRGTIGVLESTVEKLETPTPPGTGRNSGFLSGIFRGIRSILPGSWSEKLSDTALGGIIAVMTVALVWTTSTLLTNKSPDVIATVPPTTPSSVEKTGEKTTEKPIPSSEEKTPPTSEEVPTSTETPEPEDLTEVTPTLPQTEPEPKAEVTPTPTLETTPSPEPEVEVIPTPTPTTTPTLEPIPEATPEPVVELTPEQILIAAIQKQVGEISDKFISGLIKSIQANFSDSTLTLIISDDWYSFKESQQDKLASQILQQSKEFDFTHLEITDSKGSLIARNPVIGDEMVIFRR